jgi:hypothetical protein
MNRTTTSIDRIETTENSLHGIVPKKQKTDVAEHP